MPKRIYRLTSGKTSAASCCVRRTKTTTGTATMRADCTQPNDPVPAEDVVGGEHLDRCRLGRARGEVENAVELLLARERQDALEQEPVDLRLGQLIGALHFDRILRRQHEERTRQRHAAAR